MNDVRNWKYKKWENEMKESPYNTDYNVPLYINYEILSYAEETVQLNLVN